MRDQNIQRARFVTGCDEHANPKRNIQNQNYQEKEDIHDRNPVENRTMETIAAKISVISCRTLTAYYTSVALGTI
jgi:hypothetical protein